MWAAGCLARAGPAIVSWHYGGAPARSRALQLLPEREAKTIIAQVVSGLMYLNTKPHNIIHYDLKPANILFDANGECKITVRAGRQQGPALRWLLPAFLSGSDFQQLWKDAGGPRLNAAPSLALTAPRAHAGLRLEQGRGRRLHPGHGADVSGRGHLLVPAP
jgi:hypothetical protein